MYAIIQNGYMVSIVAKTANEAVAEYKQMMLDVFNEHVEVTPYTDGCCIDSEDAFVIPCTAELYKHGKNDLADWDIVDGVAHYVACNI